MRKKACSVCNKNYGNPHESSFARLKATGISDSLFKKIKSMNYEDDSSQLFIDTLLGLSPDKRQIYYDAWDRYYAKADEIALFITTGVRKDGEHNAKA